MNDKSILEQIEEVRVLVESTKGARIEAILKTVFVNGFYVGSWNGKNYIMVDERSLQEVLRIPNRFDIGSYPLMPKFLTDHVFGIPITENDELVKKMLLAAIEDMVEQLKKNPPRVEVIRGGKEK